MNQPFQDYDMGALVSWTALIQLRDGVNAALEAARNEKKIGKSLEAHITLVRAQDQADNLTALQEKFQDQWADLFIVSDVEVSDDPALYAQGSDTPIAGVRVLVSEANGDKCERCWKHHQCLLCRSVPMPLWMQTRFLCLTMVSWSEKESMTNC